jgi:CrcB protein
MEFLISVLCIMFGGALGATGRYLSQELFKLFPSVPGWIGLLVVNTLGSLLIGFSVASLQGEISTEQLKHVGRLSLHIHERPLNEGLAILAVGFCGAYTTFSSFSLDNYFLSRDQRGQMILNMIGSLALAYGAVWVGWTIGQAVLT